MPVLLAVAAATALIVLALVIGIIVRRREGRERAVSGVRLRAEDIAPTPLAPRGTLVQFSTEYCARCPQTRRLLHAVAAEHAGVEPAEIDLTRRPDLTARYGITQTPTILIFDARGDAVARFDGVPAAPRVRAAIDALPLIKEYS